MPLRDRGAAVGFGLAALLFLPGCPNPGTYTTPRTLDPGKVQIQVAAEGIGVDYHDRPSGSGSTQSLTMVLPMVPSVGGRVGVVDGLDVGFRLANLDSVGVDAKVRLVKGWVDLAIDPGVQGYYANFDGQGGVGFLYTHLPLLIGVNLSQDVSLVAAPGAMFAYASQHVVSASGVSSASTGSEWMASLGLGVDVRVPRNVAIHPGLTLMRDFSSTPTLITIFGIGFSGGAQPDYSDLAPTPAPETPPPPAAPYELGPSR